MGRGQPGGMSARSILNQSRAVECGARGYIPSHKLPLCQMREGRKEGMRGEGWSGRSQTSVGLLFELKSPLWKLESCSFPPTPPFLPSSLSSLPSFPPFLTQQPPPFATPFLTQQQPPLPHSPPSFHCPPFSPAPFLHYPSSAEVYIIVYLLLNFPSVINKVFLILILIYYVPKTGRTYERSSHKPVQDSMLAKTAIWWFIYFTRLVKSLGSMEC